MSSGIALVFPGQGSQYAGMGRELYEQYAAAREVFDQADEALGYSLKEICFSGPREILDQTEYAQPAVLTCSMAAFAVLKKHGVKASVMAGLSLGEYSALVASGSLSLSEALPLIQIRARLMQNAVPLGAGAMAAIIGMAASQVEEICSSTEGSVVIANYNAPGQVVISGSSPAVAGAGQAIKEGGGRVVPLAVSVPSHSPLMQEAAQALEPRLQEAGWQDPEIPVVSNVTGEEHEGRGQIPGLLARQLYSPVLWEQSVRQMINRAEGFVEVGPGSTLSTLIKRIDRKAVLGRVEDQSSMNSLLEKLK